MTDSDFPDFKAAMDRTARAFNKPLEGDLVATYYGDLRNYALTAVERALDKLRQTGRYFPRVAAIRELCETDSAVVVGTEIPSWVDHISEKYFCTLCDDTGFVRRIPPHTDPPSQPITRFCSCRADNPVLCRQRELMRQRRSTTREE